jgi:prepilin-type N-terminal cleavage/methylation domain-containing protein
MMTIRGMTLLELVLALSLLAVVAFGASMMTLSFGGAAAKVAKGIASQQTLDNVFRDMEMNLSNVELDTTSSTMNLCTPGETLSNGTVIAALSPVTTGTYSPRICATVFAPHWGSSKRFNIWIRGLRREADGTTKKVGYGYRYYKENEKIKTEVVRCITDIATMCDNTNTVVLAYGLQPYVDADTNNDGTLSDSEIQVRDGSATGLGCLSPANWDFSTTPSPGAKCYNTGSNYYGMKTYPIFKIAPDKKSFTVSLSPGDLKSRGVGVTKTFYIHETQGE